MDRLLGIRDAIADAMVPLGSEEIEVGQAAGRYLATAATARVAFPPCTCSAMDGYAVRAIDVAAPCTLPVATAIYAGDAPGAPLPPRSVARIFTGAPLPEGADAVVREEAVRVERERVAFTAAVRVGENVRRAGEDASPGALALPAGARLGARQRALLSAVGVSRVVVHRRPKVAVISTGDEIVGGRTPDSNGVAVAGLVRAIGAEVERRAVGDRLDEVAVAIGAAIAGADAVITIGGVSVGERDHVPAALARLGADVRVDGVPMKPGKPFRFALASGKPVFALPGSPSACLVAFEVLARPALLALSGATRRARAAVPVRLAAPAEGRPGRARLLWARLEPDGRARPLGRDTAQVRGPALADALLLVSPGAGDLPEGAEVTAWLLDDDAA